MNHQEHLLTCLAEECSEVTKDVTKSLRYGLDDRNVLDPTGPTNRERLVDELNDLAAVIDILSEQGIVPRNWWDALKQQKKRAKVAEFLFYAEKVGALRIERPKPEIGDPNDRFAGGSCT